MPSDFAAQLDRAILMILDSFVKLLFDSRISLISAFSFLIPFWSLVLIVDHLGRTRTNTRRLLRFLNQFFLFGLTINVSYNTFYFSTKGIDTFHGRMHLVAALCCLLFVIYLSFNYNASSDVRYGIMISYMGISLSLFTLPLEYFPESHKVLSSFFLLGLFIYFFGLISVAMSTNAAKLVRWLRGKKRRGQSLD